MNHDDFLNECESDYYEEEKLPLENSINIDMTTSLEEIEYLTDPNISQEKPIYYICMNPLYKRSGNQYIECNIMYNVKTDKILIDNIEIDVAISANLIQEMRFIYLSKFQEGYRSGGIAPDPGVKAMTAGKYNGKTKITYFICVQPKYNGVKIMFSSEYYNCVHKDHTDELLNFMAYIPHNCTLDVLLYINNIPSSNVNRLMNAIIIF